MKVCVVGLGKIGLPLAVQYASRGLTVAGCDIDAARVEQINRGGCPIVGEEGLEEALAAVVRAGSLRASTDTPAAVAESDVVVLIVPVGLALDRSVEFAQLDAATQAVAAGLRPGRLVVVESTVPVGTTRQRVGAALSASGGRTRDVLLAASPERVSSGRIFRDLRAYPKIIGALDDRSWERAEQFYAAALDAPCLLRVSDPETAELAKLAEGVYRDVNIALASDLARYADTFGIDVGEAFAAANSQPYSHLHDAGVGVGGHCLPVYPYFLPQDGSVALPALAREINDAMARYSVEKLERALGSLRGATVLVLGLAYRPNVKEASHSSAVLIAKVLGERGARPLVHDPLFSHDEIRAHGLEPPDRFPAPVDAIVVQAWHDAYRKLDLVAFAGCRALLDGRNALDREAVEAAGMQYVGIGR